MDKEQLQRMTIDELQSAYNDCFIDALGEFDHIVYHYGRDVIERRLEEYYGH